MIDSYSVIPNTTAQAPAKIFYCEKRHRMVAIFDCATCFRLNKNKAFWAQYATRAQCRQRNERAANYTIEVEA
jgi:N-acetyl-gamma-glutamylphosphate reductase